MTPVRFWFNQTEVYHVSKASSLRSSPSPLKVGGWCSFAANLVVLSSALSGGGAGGSAGPASDMLSLLSLSLSLLELSVSGGGAISPFFSGVDRNSPGLVSVSFSNAFADSVSTTGASSLDSCQAASSISNCLLTLFCSLRAFSLKDFSVCLVSSSREISLPVLVFRFETVSSLTC